MPLVRIKNGPDKGKSFEVGETPVVIGRETPEGVRILDQGASRKHAEIFKIGEMYFIRDLESKNGTFVNDERIAEELLQVGDKIKIGSTLFAFEETGVAQEAQPPERNIQFSSVEQLEATMEIDLAGVKKTELASEEPGAHKTLKTLFEVGKALVTEEDEKSLLQKVLFFAVDALSADAGYTFARDPDDRLIPVAIHEKNTEEGRKISRSIIKRVFKTQKAVMTSDAAQDARFKDRQSVVIKKIQSVICVPLMALDKIKGVMYLHGSGIETVFSQEDFELAAFIGIQTGHALESLRASARQRRILMSAIKTMVAILELRNPKSRGHSERVCVYSAAIANCMNMRPEEGRNVQFAALLHDIGKIVKSEKSSVIQRDSDVVSDEAGGVEDHVIHGEDIIRHMEGMETVLPGIRSHHENFNGTGYPDGLSGDAIPFVARVIRVADAFDHEIHGAPAVPQQIKEAVVRIGKNEQGLFDPMVCKCMVLAYRNGTLFTPEKLMLEEYFGKVEGG